MSQTEINTAINNAEASLVIEGLSVSKQTKALCKKLLAKEINMSVYIAIIKQNAMVSQNGI